MHVTAFSKAVIRSSSVIPTPVIGFKMINPAFASPIYTPQGIKTILSACGDNHYQAHQ
nr:MAG TPA_asm: hypothetical protein [Caudoviricetes sp.]DAP91903.1 MAG TPA: hypothetical protein [Caudoviricetes sp.]